MVNEVNDERANFVLHVMELNVYFFYLHVLYSLGSIFLVQLPFSEKKVWRGCI